MNAQVVEFDRSSAELNSPGSQLRSTREARGLDLARAAQMLHLPPSTLAAIEADDHAALPGPVFVRGYLRNYARLLNLDEETILGRLKGGGPTESARPPRVRGNGREEIRSSHFAVRLVSWLISLSVAGLLYLWWINPVDLSSLFATRIGGLQGEQPKSAAPSQAPSGKVSTPLPTPSSSIPTKAEPAPALVKPTTAAAVPAAPPRPEPAVIPAPAPETGVAAVPAPEKPVGATPGIRAPADTPAQAPSSQGVVLEFSDTAWVDVRDATKSFRIYGDIRKGERRELGGTPPYTLILGNARAVQVTVNGVPFDIKSRTRGNVARFTLDPKGGE